MSKQNPEPLVAPYADVQVWSEIDTTNIYLAKPDYAAMLVQARQTQGGHLMIGHGGCVLYYAQGRSFTVYDAETIKAACLHAGVPVIYVRFMDFEKLWTLAAHGPMIAVGEAPRFLLCRAFSTEALEVVANDYRAAGAEIYNIPLDAT